MSWSRPAGAPASLESELGGHGAGDERRFDGVVEDVLRVAVAILEHADELHELGMESVHAYLEHGALSRFANRVVELLLGFPDHLLDSSRWMRPSETRRSSARRASSRRMGCGRR
jgi:hypothetical protein